MKNYRIINGSNRIGYIKDEVFYLPEHEWMIQNYSVAYYAHRDLKFSVPIYRRLKKAMSILEDYNKLGKRMFGKNFCMTEECLELSPSKLFENLVEKKCYMVIKIPKVICKVYDYKAGTLNKLTSPVNDMYICIEFLLKLSERYIKPELSINSNIYGFQGGFDSKWPLIFPHLSSQNTKFCLGSSELQSLVYLLAQTDIIDNPTLDILEHIFNYLEIYLGCQSNEGGPYHHMETKIYTSTFDNNIEYYTKLLQIYFLCVPRSEWVIIPNTTFFTKSDYSAISCEILITDVDRILVQLNDILPEIYKSYVSPNKYSLKNPDSISLIGTSVSGFRFYNEKITSVKVDNPITDFYTDPNINKPVFFSNKFKTEFVDFINEKITSFQRTTICEKYL